MSTFSLIILIMFISIQVGAFIHFVDKNKNGFACLSAASILMFVYLARTLM